MPNVLKLKGKLVEKDISYEEFADMLGIDSSTLYRRFKSNGENFSIGEVNKIVKALDLRSDEAAAIFFDQ
jgi:predicted transcriptional regulator